MEPPAGSIVTTFPPPCMRSVGALPPSPAPLAEEVEHVAVNAWRHQFLGAGKRGRLRRQRRLRRRLVVAALKAFSAALRAWAWSCHVRIIQMWPGRSETKSRTNLAVEGGFRRRCIRASLRPSRRRRHARPSQSTSRSSPAPAPASAAPSRLAMRARARRSCLTSMARRPAKRRPKFVPPAARRSTLPSTSPSARLAAGSPRRSPARSAGVDPGQQCRHYPAQRLCRRADAVAKDWQDTLAVNLDGVFNVTQAFLDPLRATKDASSTSPRSSRSSCAHAELPGLHHLQARRARIYAGARGGARQRRRARQCHRPGLHRNAAQREDARQ